MTTGPARARVAEPWSTSVAIRFSHCDPASIVYFASHFDILNGVIEDWFIEALGIDYPDVVRVRRVGLGYVHASCDFATPARMGDHLVYSVTVERVGTKSIPVRVIARKGTTEVLFASLVIVTTDLDLGVSVPIPDDIRAAVTSYLGETGVTDRPGVRARANGLVHQVLQPDAWPLPRGYVNGVAAKGRMVFTGGLIGWDAAGRFAADFAGQTRQTLVNTLAVLRLAAAGPEHVVRMTWYVCDVDEYRAARQEIGVAYAELMGRNYPAMAVVEVTRLVEPLARLEIETTAVVPE